MFSKLQDKTSVDKLIKILSQRYGKRHGGYSRILKTGFRYGDDAPMAIIELVDRDINAKKVDIKTKPVEKAPEKQENKKIPTEKKHKSKK